VVVPDDVTANDVILKFVQPMLPPPFKPVEVIHLARVIASLAEVLEVIGRRDATPEDLAELGEVSVNINFLLPPRARLSVVTDDG
jgi:hypothetical protein